MIAALRVVLLVTLTLAVAAASASAQYAEIPRPLAGATNGLFGPAPDTIRAATQIGRRLFIGGSFTHVSPPLGGAAVVDATGTLVPGAFPHVAGDVWQIVADGVGGWVVIGDFSSVDGLPVARVARVTPQRAVDPRFHVVANGPIRQVTVAHGRIYLAGTFTTINGASRRGLAALSAETGQLTSWASSFDSGGRYITALSTSSIGVYLAGTQPLTNGGRLWGLDTAGHVLFARNLYVTALAATSARVYVGGVGYARPVRAVDPATGDDVDWTIGFTFLPLQSTTGDYTGAYAMLVDDGRLYVGGALRTADGRGGLVAVDVATGARLPFRWSAGNSVVAIVRVGPVIVTVDGTGDPHALDAATGAAYPFATAVFGQVRTIAAAPEGVVAGGALNGAGGVARAGLASVNLDTYHIEPWTSTLSLPSLLERVDELATDGTWLFARTSEGVLAKIDPVSGAVAASRSFGPVLSSVTMRVRGGEIVVAASGYAAATVLGVLTIADWSFRVLARHLHRVRRGESGRRWRHALPLRRFRHGERPEPAILGRRASLDGIAPAMAPGARHLLRPARPRGGRSGLGGRSVPRRGRRAASWPGGTGSRVRRGAAVEPGRTRRREFRRQRSGQRPRTRARRAALRALGGYYVSPDERIRPTAGGQETPRVVAYSLATGRRVPWRHGESGLLAVLADCLLVERGCLPRAVTPPTDLHITQSGAAFWLAWTLPAEAAARGSGWSSGVQRDGPTSTRWTCRPRRPPSARPRRPGGTSPRVRSLAGPATSGPTGDVSFAVGAGVPAAPLDVTAAVDGRHVTIAWRPPSTGAPQRYVLEVGSREGQRDFGSAPIAGDASSLSVDAPPGTYWSRLVAVTGTERSAASGELLITMTPRDTCQVAPDALAALVASVADRTVSLSWQLPPAGAPADIVRVVAGSAPGRTDLGSIDVLGPATSFSVVAPPGTYYVTVVAANGCGESAPSNELPVVVP